MGVRNVYGINTYDGYVGDDGNGNYQGETGPVKGKTTVNNDKGKGTKAKAVSATVVAGTAIMAGRTGIATEEKGTEAASSLTIGWSVALAEPSPVGEAVMGAATAATFLYAIATSDYVRKMQKETETLLKRALGPNGFTYVLVTTQSGLYNMYSRGSSSPTGTIQMGAGEIWKIGETTSGQRYDPAYLLKEKVIQVPFYFGNQVEIKLKEKFLLYGYFFTHGKLPPGNKMFK